MRPPHPHPQWSCDPGQAASSVLSFLPVKVRCSVLSRGAPPPTERTLEAPFTRKGPWPSLTLPGPQPRPEHRQNPPHPSPAPSPRLRTARPALPRPTHHRRCSCTCCTSPSPAGSGRPASSSSPRRRGRRSPGTGWLPGPSCGSRRRRSCTCCERGREPRSVCEGGGGGSWPGDRGPHGPPRPLRAVATLGKAPRPPSAARREVQTMVVAGSS